MFKITAKEKALILKRRKAIAKQYDPFSHEAMMEKGKHFIFLIKENNKFIVGVSVRPNPKTGFQVVKEFSNKSQAEKYIDKVAEPNKDVILEFEKSGEYPEVTTKFIKRTDK